MFGSSPTPRPTFSKEVRRLAGQPAFNLFTDRATFTHTQPVLARRLRDNDSILAFKPTLNDFHRQKTDWYRRTFLTISAKVATHLNGRFLLFLSFSSSNLLGARLPSSIYCVRYSLYLLGLLDLSSSHLGFARTIFIYFYHTLLLSTTVLCSRCNLNAPSAYTITLGAPLTVTARSWAFISSSSFELGYIQTFRIGMGVPKKQLT